MLPTGAKLHGGDSAEGSRKKAPGSAGSIVLGPQGSLHPAGSLPSSGASESISCIWKHEVFKVVRGVECYFSAACERLCAELGAHIHVFMFLCVCVVHRSVKYRLCVHAHLWLHESYLFYCVCVLHLFVHVCVWVCVFTCERFYMDFYLCVAYTFVCTSIFWCMYVCVHLYLNACSYVCVYSRSMLASRRWQPCCSRYSLAVWPVLPCEMTGFITSQSTLPAESLLEHTWLGRIAQACQEQGSVLT